jgi:excisionase family DNA binding protein
MHSAAVHHSGRHAIAPAEDRMLSIKEVSTRTQRHRATIYKLIAQREFPAGKMIGKRRNWWLSDVLAWLDRQPDASPP